MTMECTWSKKIEEDEDTLMPGFGVMQNIKCFKYGKTLYVRNADNNSIVSTMAYIVKEEVKVGDILDNQVVKSVDSVPEFDGQFALYECLTWKTRD